MFQNHMVSGPPMSQELPQVVSGLNKNFFLMMVSSLGIVAGLGWNDAIKSLFDHGAPLYRVKEYGLWVVALALTILAYFATALFTKLYPGEQITPRQSPIRVN